MRDFKDEGSGDALFERNLQNLSALGPNRFSPLTPAYAYGDDTAIEAYTQKKLRNLAAERNLRLTSPEVQAMDLDDEDTLIADPHFAALLNAERELVIGSTRYKYTKDGVFMADKNAVAKLRATAARFQANPRVYKSEAYYDLGGGVGYFPQQYASEDHISTTVTPAVVASAAPVASRTQSAPRQLLRADDCIQQAAPLARHDMRLIPIEDGCGGGGSGGGSGGSGGGTSGGPPKQPPLDSFPVCSGLRKSIWNKIFGPSTVCTQNWEKRKRIKTKVWNQNYFVYSSIGISVRSQSRKLRIWWAKKTNELVLGYNTVTFDYPWAANAPLNPAMFPPANHYTYYYKGQRVNQYGGWVNTGGKIWDTGAFPITTVNDNWLEVQVYVPVYGKNIGTTISTKDLNGYAESALKSAINKFINKQKKPDKDTPTVVTAMTNDKARYIHHNWKKRRTNENKIQEIFDWNTAVISVTFNPGSNSGASPDLKKTAKSYDRLAADVYGIGRRGNSWKGSRIEYIED